MMVRNFHAKYILSFLFCSAISLSFAQKQTVISSASSIDWTKDTFSSAVSLDMERAGIKMPSGKNSAVNKIETEMPELIKDPLLSLYVNSYQQLGDLVFSNDITLEQLTDIIDAGERTPGIFANGGSELRTNHKIQLTAISDLMIRHHYPYKNAKPIEEVASRPYSGIIIDARGSLPVQGEFINDIVSPCFFPQIWDEKMNLIYERNMGDPELERAQQMVLYHWSDNEDLYQDRIGLDPMHIHARRVYGRFRTDPVISRKDALKILSVPENLELLRQGKVVILLDKDKLIQSVGAPLKDEAYYTDYRTVKQHFATDVDAPIIIDGIPGLQFLYDLKFVADSAKLLPSELPKLQRLADSLKSINADSAYTILVEGHTADVNKPAGQMRLSVERTQTIIDVLVQNGLPRSIFSYRGYGGTVPIASNDTPEGRAANRRVIITARPKATYIQRQ
ncbi:MAG: OmpA family protein [Treponema sp.]|nr:OmpA family protein [Treponema sp.]